MPVHEVRYRAYEGERAPGFARALAIPRFTLLSVFNKWVATSVFGIGLLAFLGITILLVVTNNIALLEMLPFLKELPKIPPGQLLRVFFAIQYFVCIVPLLLAAPKMIAPELQHKALPILFSRPITRTGYILGKAAALAALIGFLTWVQATVIFVLMAAFYPPDHPFIENFFSSSLVVFGKLTIMGALMTATLVMIGLASSAATKNVRFAGLILLVTIFGSEAASAMFSGILSTDRLWFGLSRLFLSLDQQFFTPEASQDLSIRHSMVGILGWLALSTLFVYTRLKPVEVFKE